VNILTQGLQLPRRKPADARRARFLGFSVAALALPALPRHATAQAFGRSSR
jgi:hypothetical protein